jgi:hypothetical protein
MAKRTKLEKIDGLGPREIRDIRSSIRQVWHRSHARALCVKRCIGADGFSYCEKCKKRAPKVFIDHIETVGDVDAGFIKRLFVPSKGLQGLCKKCHALKTKMERKRKKLTQKKKGEWY